MYVHEATTISINSTYAMNYMYPVSRIRYTHNSGLSQSQCNPIISCHSWKIKFKGILYVCWKPCSAGVTQPKSNFKYIFTGVHAIPVENFTSILYEKVQYSPNFNIGDHKTNLSKLSLHYWNLTEELPL